MGVLRGVLRSPLCYTTWFGFSVLELIYVSGGFEILFGLMLIFERTRLIAGWGLILLLIAVYPANLYLAFNTDVQKEMNISSFLASWVRLPLQFVFIGLAHWHSINHKPIRTKIISNKRSTNSSKKILKKLCFHGYRRYLDIKLKMKLQ